MAIVQNLETCFLREMRADEAKLDATSIRIVAVADKLEDRDDLAADELRTDRSDQAGPRPESASAK